MIAEGPAANLPPHMALPAGVLEEVSVAKSRLSCLACAALFAGLLSACDNGARQAAQGDDAAAKIKAGARLVQLYTGFIYRGPELIGEAAKAIATI